MTRLACLIAAALIVSGPLASAAPAEARTCTWGKPGYRACVEEKLRARQAAEPDAPRDRRTRFKTAPAAHRPPALTPVAPETPRAIAGPSAPDTGARRAYQRQFDVNVDRQRPEANPGPILPPQAYPNTIPGRICPSWGC